MSPSYLRILENLKKKKSSKKRLRHKPALRLEALEPRKLMSANPLIPGDIVVVQVGNGTAQTTSNAAQVYLDEYTPSGTLVQQVPLSISTTGGNIALTASGTAGGAGQISLSPNGQELTIFGYNDSTLTANTAGQPQSVGIVGANGTIYYEASSTNITTNANAAAISNANAVYIGGNSGLYYAGTFASGSTSMVGANVGLGCATSLQIDNGELFGSSSKSGGIWNFGSSLPTGATTPTELTTGTGTYVDGSSTAVTVSNDAGGTTSYAPGAPVGFFFANLGSANATYDGMYDTLYVADDATACGAILKYSYDSSTGNWTYSGGIEGLTNNDSIIGVTGTVNGGNVTLEITAGGSEAGGTKVDGGYVYTVTDNTGAGGNPSSLALANAVQNSNSANIEFRGVVQAPDDGNGTLGNFFGTDDYTQGASAIAIDSAANFTDSSNFDGGSLTIGGAGAYDTLAVASGGGITLSGNVVSYNGTVIGAYPASGAGSGINGANLTITFDAIGNEASPNATTGTGEVVTSAAVQALMQSITFSSSSSSTTGDRTLAFKVSENNGNATSADETVDVAAPATGNLPTITQSSNIGVNESASPGLETVDLSGITANGTGQTLTVTATSNNESVVAIDSITVNYDSANSPSTGNITFTPVASAAGNATITVTVTDSNGSIEDAFEFTSVAPPAITAPANQSASEDTNHGLSFSGSAIADSFLTPGDTMTVTLADVDGTLTANNTVGGGASVSNDGSANVTLTGNVSQINTTLAAGVTYNGGASFTGNDTLTITANDAGNTASDSAQSSSATVTIDVEALTIAVNNGLATPVGAKTYIYGTASGNIVAGQTMLNATDPDYSTANITYTLTAVPTEGTLYSNATGNAVPLTVGSTFAQGDINGNSSDVWYVSNANATAGSTDSFSFTVSDTANNTASGTFNMNVDTPSTVSYGTPNANYTQNFSALPSTPGNGPAFLQDGPYDFVGNATSTPPQGIGSNATLAGWSMDQYGNTSNSAVEKFFTDSGNAQTTGGVYSFGANGSTTRSLGMVGTSAATSEIGVTLVNTTGETINDISLSYLGEQFTENANLNTLTFGYSVGGTAVNGSGFVTDSALNYAGTLTNANATENANGVPLASANVAGTIGNLNWAPGETLVLRWQIAGVGSASGLAIANFSFSGDAAPVLAANTSATAAIDSSVTITNTELQVTDTDDTDANLTYTLSSVPADGTLQLNGSPLSTSPGSNTFTQADIDNGDLTFVGGASTGSGNFGFTVTDPANASVSGNFTVAVGQAPLVLTHDTGITLLQGGNATIGTAALELTETGVSDDSTLVYTLQSAPTHGTLKDSGSTLAANSTFTQADIDDGDLTYAQDGSENLSDSFTFTASDGQGGSVSASSFAITITAVPTVTTNTGLATPTDATTYIHGTVGGNITSNTMLNTSDGNVAAANLTYTLTGVPTDGNLYITGNSTALSIGSTFTQSQIVGNTSQLYYLNSGAAGVSTDSFSFTVSDGVNASANTTFSIAVDQPTTVSYTTPNANYTETFSGLPSTPGSGPTFTQDGPFDFVGNATSTPPQGIGSGVSLDGWSMDQYGNTTLTGNVGNSAAEKFFTDSGNAQTTGGLYSVGANGSTTRALGMVGTSGAASDIGVTLVNNTDETINDITVSYLGEQFTENANLNTLTFGYSVGGTAVNGSGFTTDSALNYAATLAGTNSGNAIENANGVPLACATVSGLIGNLSWAPGETLVLRWQIGSVGSASGLAIANFSFSGDAAPVLAANAGITTSVESTANITSSLLQVTDIDNVDSQLTYTLSSVPSNGTLQLNGTALSTTPGSNTFTQADVDNGLVTFVAGDSTGSSSFGFTASDPAGASVSGTFDIGVGQAPLVLTNDTGIPSGLLQGGTATITSTELELTETGASNSSLEYTLGNAPLHGTLKDNGNDILPGGTFTQADIDAGYLTYTQNDSENFSDSFTFTANDGASGSISTSNFAITITPVPTVTTNTGFTTPAGDLTYIYGNNGNSTMLITSDGSVASSNIAYTLTAVPTDGTLYSNATGNAVALTVGSTFTQHDINGSTSHLWYVSDNTGGVPTDNFSFTVSDGTNTSANTAFTINVDQPTTVSYGTANSTYTQNFDALPSTPGNGPAFVQDGPFDFVGNASSTQPQGIGSNATLDGWSMAQYGNTSNSASEKFVTDFGNAQTTGAVYSYGANGASNRALGIAGTSSTDSEIGVTLVNNTGETLNQISIDYLGEQFTSNANLNTLVFDYALGDASITGAGFTAVSALNYAGTVTGANAAENANGVPLASADVSDVIAGLDWTPGETLVLRWQAGAVGSASGLAIDNFSFSATSATPPVFTNSGSYTGSVNTETAANGTSVANVSATSDNGDTVSYGITGGNANGAFAVAANGAITVANAAAITGTSYSLTVEATDSTNDTTANATLTVAVATPPVFGQANYPLSAISATIANGTSVGNVAATPESGDTLGYALSGAGNSAFAVDSTGNITVANDSALSAGNYTLTLTATDTTNEDTATANVSISVSAIHIGTQPAFTVNKLAANGAVVGTVVANDTATLSYSLANTGSYAANDALFAINSNTGAITVANGAALPASIASKATSANLTVDVLLSDNTGGSANDTITIVDSANGTMAPTLVNANDANQTINLAENSKALGNVANVASDVTAAYTSQKFTYTLANGVGNDADFKISSTGLITAVNELAYATGTSYQFTVDVADSKSPGAVTAMDLTVNVLDQAPTITGANGALTVNDNKTIDPLSKIKVADVVANQPLTVTISLSEGGTDGNLSLANVPVGATFTPNIANGTYTITGDAGIVTTAIDKLVFTPTKNLVAVNSSTDTTFNVKVDDGLATASSIVTNATTEVGSLSINDAPTITIPTTTNGLGKTVPVSAGQTVSDETATVNSVSYTGTIAPFTQVTVADPDVGQSLTVTVTIPLANGTLAGGGFDGGVINAKNITYTYTAAYTAGMTAAEVSQAATSALQALVFTPTAHQVAPGKTVTTTFAITVSDSVVKTPTSNKSTTVIATAVNDMPVVTVGTANVSVNDNATTKPLATGNVAVSDNNDYGVKDTLTVTLTNANLGTLSGGGVKQTANGTGIYTVAGNMAQLTADLANITFTPKQNLVVPGTVTDEAIHINLEQGSQTSANSTVTLAITSINNAPTITGTSNTAIKVNDNGANSTVNPFTSKVTIGDVDVGQTETATITLSNAANGNLSLTNGPGDVTFTAQGNGVYTLSGGNAADTTTALRELVFTPTAHQVDLKANVTTTFNISVTDSGNVTTGTSAMTASDDKTTVVATAVDSAPTALNATLTTPAVTGPVAVGTSVLTLSTVDADLGDKFTYSLVSVSNVTNQNSQFKIGTGAEANQLVVGNSKGLAAGTYAVSLEVKDSGGKSVIKTFSIVIAASGGTSSVS